MSPVGCTLRPAIDFEQQVGDLEMRHDAVDDFLELNRHRSTSRETVGSNCHAAREAGLAQPSRRDDTLSYYTGLRNVVKIIMCAAIESVRCKNGPKSSQVAWFVYASPKRSRASCTSRRKMVTSAVNSGGA